MEEQEVTRERATKVRVCPGWGVAMGSRRHGHYLTCWWRRSRKGIMGKGLAGELALPPTCCVTSSKSLSLEGVASHLYDKGSMILRFLPE